MSDTTEALITKARTDFASFFKWADALDGMIKDQIGPKFGLVVNEPEADAATGVVSGSFTVTRPLKDPLVIPFKITGKTIVVDHDKFFLTDKATSSKITEFSIDSMHDINRILGDIVQNYIG